MNNPEEIESDFNKAKRIEEDLVLLSNKIKENPLSLTTSVYIYN